MNLFPDVAHPQDRGEGFTGLRRRRGPGEGRTVPSETLKGLAGWPSENKITNQYGMQPSQCDGKVRANLSCLLKLNE